MPEWPGDSSAGDDHAQHRLLARAARHVQARVSALQADLYRLGMAFSVTTHHDPPPRTDGGQVTVFGERSKTRVVLLPSAIRRELLRFRQGAGLDAPAFPSPPASPETPAGV